MSAISLMRCVGGLNFINYVLITMIVYLGSMSLSPRVPPCVDKGQINIPFARQCNNMGILSINVDCSFHVSPPDECTNAHEGENRMRGT